MMSGRSTQAAKILVVDDLPEKLLVYRSILDDSGDNVVTASSGAEALRLVLNQDFAVILLDVNMPDMDGFETAKLIRGRKRSSHTPIIFVTAHLDEVHALQGYAYGAVDFIPAPVVPDILRTKVRVFVQLYELTQQVREQAERQLARAEREQARLATVLDKAIDFVARLDKDLTVSSVNPGGRAMLGYQDAVEMPRRLSDYYPPQALEAMRTAALPGATRDGAFFAESVLRAKSGAAVPVSQVIVAHTSADGQIEHFSIVARDISRRLETELALSESEKRYRQLVHSLPAAAYTCDSSGTITLFNAAAATLWGREPRLGEDKWCGSHRIMRPDGSDLPLDSCPMAIAIREGRAVRGDEIIIERADGTRRHVLPYPEPLRDSAGRVVGAVNMLVDVTELKAAERGLRDREARLRAMFGQAAVGIGLIEPNGRFVEVNERLCQILGRSRADLVTLTCRSVTHPDDWVRNEPLMKEVASGARREFSIEKRYRRADAEWVWVNVAVSPIVDDAGRVIRMVTVVEDISARRSAEQELAQHRDHLEQLVRDRTEELEASLERLRLSDRLASVGTLAAGLGHDMGNLLMPIRMRLDTLKQMDLPEEAREDIKAIADACEYLKRLNQGLRLFALNPEDAGSVGESTHLAAWWPDVAGFMRNTLHRGIDLEAIFPTDLPAVAIAPHLLTQTIYNLIQNAGDALQGRSRGKVRVTAFRAPRGVTLAVSDDGPGMSEEVRRRCVEPFFTTKKRGISTGLGLALVHGAMRKTGGELDILSNPGEGSTFRLTLPVVRSLDEPGTPESEASTTVVDLKDPRLRTYAAIVLRSLGREVNEHESWSGTTRAGLVVIDDPGERAPELAEWLASDQTRRVVQIGGGRPVEAAAAGRVFMVSSPATAALVRRVLRAATMPTPAEAQEVVT
jgi:PAS domain S-box-containing protein